MRNGRDAKEERRINAENRQAFRAKLTPKQQLEELDLRLGKGIGAKRERTRLLSLIDAKG